MKNRKEYNDVFKAKVALEDVKGVTVMYRVFAFTQGNSSKLSGRNAR
ncbi:MAG: hypothetical protein BWY86_00295 [Candidatus Aminicenantes bacterium ADurb.Bin508]|nr:MAG: hypothetical protein BWY86_00295 [Candidatus Aminicenantes bacterium ADurb.Bin508]